MKSSRLLPDLSIARACVLYDFEIFGPGAGLCDCDPHIMRPYDPQLFVQRIKAVLS
jgi:hypothetical protein